MPRPTNALNELAKYVEGINRYENEWNWYDLIFRHYRTGKVEYARAIHYDALLSTITEYLVTRRKACVGVFQNTRYKGEILILISG